MRKLRNGALLIALFFVVALLAWQQLEIRRLSGENTDLRGQLSQSASLQETNAQLAERLNEAIESSKGTVSEVARLRGQSSRLRQLEQENTQLKAQRQALDQQVRQAQSAALASVQQPAPVPPAAPAERPVTDLGPLELADGVAVRFDLGGGTNCVVTPTAQPDGNVMMQIQSQITNTDGTASTLATSRITARPGQQCSISVGDRMIALAVKLK